MLGFGAIAELPLSALPDEAEVDDGSAGPATGGAARPVSRYRVFDTYTSPSSKPTPNVLTSIYAVEQQQREDRARLVALKRAVVIAAILAASEDDYGF